MTALSPHEWRYVEDTRLDKLYVLCNRCNNSTCTEATWPTYTQGENNE